MTNCFRMCVSSVSLYTHCVLHAEIQGTIQRPFHFIPHIIQKQSHHFICIFSCFGNSTVMLYLYPLGKNQDKQSNSNISILISSFYYSSSSSLSIYPWVISTFYYLLHTCTFTFSTPTFLYMLN